MNMENKLDFLINYLLSERKDIKNIKIPDNEHDKFNLYRGLVNVRPASNTDSSFLEAEDSFLKELTAKKGITDIKDLRR